MLNVMIASFSYIYGSYPKDESDNGGGFIFDCRALPNPGKNEEFRVLSGKDQAVRTFLDQDSEVNAFMDSVYSLVSQSIRIYHSRNFTNLMIGFGCTGGQHRSVYAAERLARQLKENFDLKVILVHLSEDFWR